MATIHWLGAGLSSAPGIRTLAAGPNELVLWNRTLSRAQEILAPLGATASARVLDFEQLAAATQAGDILVSMLPGEFHARVAELALDGAAHFVSSSYLSPAMQQLDGRARAEGLCLVNEVGLDPGIDHLMAHSLVDDYRQWQGHSADCRLSFRSYCGGFPLRPNEFRYKFSWSPVGVLRALKSPARCIEGGAERRVAHPWEAISDYLGHLPDGEEVFEAYPNRDSLPFLQQYRFDPDWQVQQFVRGTLRLAGWSEAWSGLFREIQAMEGEDGEARLTALGKSLWQQHAYGPDELDRVVLCVELESRRGAETVWHRGYALDEAGNARGSAMARLVSLTVAMAVESVAAGKIAPGVSAAPEDPATVAAWFGRLRELGETILYRDYLAQGA